MALRVANAGVALSSTTGFDTVVNTPTLHATANTTVNTTARFTTTFTAPNTTNASTGVLIHCVATGTYDWVVTLQENSIDTAATVTINNADLQTNTWVYFRFPTPYVYTATTANYYRFKVQGTGTSTTNGTAASDSGGSLYAFLGTDNRTGALGATDDVYICGHNMTTAINCTVAGTATTVGSGTDITTTPPSMRSVGYALVICGAGKLTTDTAANMTLTVKGQIGINGNGLLEQGTIASPVPNGVLNKIVFNPTATGDQGVNILTTGKHIMQGEAKTTTSLWKTKYVSGTGVAASPLVTSTAVDWAVGDEIVITATGDSATNYNEVETKFIITKNSSTSYVVSNTSGGAEAALTYTHTTDAYIVNLTRNVQMTTNNSARGFFYWSNAQTAGNVAIKWARFENIAGGASSRNGVNVVNGATTSVGACDYSVAYNTLTSRQSFGIVTTKVPTTHTGLVAYSGTNSTSGAILISLAYNQTMVDCFAIKTGGMGLQNGQGYNNIWRNCVVNGFNTGASAALGGIHIGTSGVLTFDGCEATAGRVQGVMANGCFASAFTNCSIGDKGKVTIGINTVADTYEDITFDNCTFNATDTLITNYLITLSGSEFRFNKLNGTANKHYWYNPLGSAQTTGASLVDTTVRTPGSLGLRLTPEDVTSGFYWQFLVLAKALSIVNFFGWFQLNSTFTGDAGASARIELWLPGASAASATSTLSKSTNAWQAVAMSAINTNATDGLAIMKVYGLTATVGAYVYADDFYNAGDTVASTDKVTGLDTWYQGKPAPIIAPQATSAADIWTFPTANLTTAGTTGNHLAKKVSTKVLPSY